MTEVNFATVRGPTMNRIYPAGSVIGWIPVDGSPMISGSCYIVQRTTSLGETETGVRSFIRDRAGNGWMCFESTDPCHYQPLPDRLFTIVGRVVSLYREEDGEGEGPVRLS
jgi:hypothetical protein